MSEDIKKTFWDKTADEYQLYRELQDRFVPTTGEAPTEQGKVLRAMSNVYYDVYNNGGFNFDTAHHKQMRQTWEKFLLAHCPEFTNANARSWAAYAKALGGESNTSMTEGRLASCRKLLEKMVRLTVLAIQEKFVGPDYSKESKDHLPLAMRWVAQHKETDESSRKVAQARPLLDMRRVGGYTLSVWVKDDTGDLVIKPGGSSAQVSISPVPALKLAKFLTDTFAPGSAAPTLAQWLDKASKELEVLLVDTESTAQ